MTKFVSHSWYINLVYWI